MPKPPSSVAVRGGLAIVLGASLWGLFWIPLRRLDATGVEGLWSVALVSAAAFVAAFLLALGRDGRAALGDGRAWRVGAALGLSAVLYFTGVLIADVVRVIFLFYLLPLWTTLAARLVYGEPIRGGRLLVIAVALAGLWLLLGDGGGWPLPAHAGDWCGLAAGFFWGLSLALLRGHEDMPPFTGTAAALGSAALIAFVLAVALAASGMAAPAPGSGELARALPLALLFGGLVLAPAMLSQVWGAQRVAAPTAALLTMTEILVATVSAWWLVGTELGAVAFAGGLVIVAAVLLDIALSWRAPPARPGDAVSRTSP